MGTLRMRSQDYVAKLRFLIITLTCLLYAASWASASGYKITVNSLAQERQSSGQGCTITEAIELTGLFASVVDPGVQVVRVGEPTLGNCTVELGGEAAGITIVVPAGEYLLTAPYLNLEGQAGFPLIGPAYYPWTGAIWGVKIVGDPAGGTIIKRDPNPDTPKFRLFHVQTWLELEHLTLSGGDADSNGGGAIFGDDSHSAECPPSGSCHLPITLRHVTLENNRAYQGGAVSSTYRVYGQGFALTIEDSTFRGNRASLGGAVNVPTTGWASIIRSQFENNVAEEFGGAIDSYTSKAIEITERRVSGSIAAHRPPRAFASFFSAASCDT